MAFNKIPSSASELEKLNLKYFSEIVSQYTLVTNKYNIKDPFAFDKSQPKIVKIIRALQEDVNLSKLNTKNVTFSFGNGSRGGGGSYNKGLIFEKELWDQIQTYLDAGIENVTKYKDAVEEIMSLIPKGHYPTKIDLDGGKNTPRPLTFSGNKITTGKIGDIGKEVTDLTLWYRKGTGREKPIYLSLKLGGTVTFVNAGVKKILLEHEMVENNIKNRNGKALLNLFSIDENKFSDVFNNYTGRGSGKDEVIIGLTGNSQFKTFMESVIGYGYILVHKIGQKVHIEEITKAKMKSFIHVKSAKILYPKNGSAKRIDVVIEMNGITIKINIRNKQGGVYPSHIMADYVMKH